MYNWFVTGRRRRRRPQPAALAVAVAMVSSLVAVAPAAARTAAVPAATPVAGAAAAPAAEERTAVAPAQRDAILPRGWRRSQDRAWTTAGDPTGLHLMVADARSGYVWRTVATLAEPGFETDLWLGNMCFTGSGRRAVVVYAPRQFTNREDSGGGSQAGRAASEPAGDQVTASARRPWWRNPALTVPAAATVLAAVIGAVAAKWPVPDTPRATPSSVAPSTRVPASGAAGTPGPTPTPTSVPPQPGADSPTVRRAQDDLLIQGGHRIELDELYEDAPEWGYEATIFPSDVYLSHDGTLWVDYLKVQAAPTKAACEQPGYLNGQIADDDVTQGMVLCVKSSEGRYVRVTVAQVDRKLHTIRIDVLVWK
ncbi:hypothetical protein ACWCQL_24655 [Streptomyces sp. NPDC002073]